MNYLVDIYTKWRGRYFYFMAKYGSPGPNRIAPFFDIGFARLEYAGGECFNLAYFRHTGQWWQIGRKAKLDEYKRLHARIWPGVLKMIKECHIQNFSIYLTEIGNGEYYLFSYLEYVGDDLEKDTAKMKADPINRRWWTYTDPCQFAVPAAREGELLHAMEEVFHAD